MDFLHLLLWCLFYCQMTTRQVQAANLSDVHTVCAEERGTAVFPWSLALDPGQHLKRINWAQSTPTSRDVLEIDGSGTQTHYVAKASTNGSAFLILTNVADEDVGNYTCIVRINGTYARQEDVAELKLKTLPDFTMLAIKVTAVTPTSAILELKEVPGNDACYEVLTYHIQYAFGSSGSWQSVRSITGSAYGNTTLNFNVTGLNTAGMYKFAVSAEHSLGTSNSVESAFFFIKGLQENSNVRNCASFGTLTGAMLAGVIVTACMMGNISPGTEVFYNEVMTDKRDEKYKRGKQGQKKPPCAKKPT